MPITRGHAQKALAAIRLVNGGAALFIPKRMAKTIGVDPDAHPAVIYVLRLFGIRTILIGLDLLTAEGEHLENSFRLGILIHASDATAAAIAGMRQQLPKRSAITATVISTVNTALAIIGSTKKD
jgi:hypothetical protein